MKISEEEFFLAKMVVNIKQLPERRRRKVISVLFGYTFERKYVVNMSGFKL